MRKRIGRVALIAEMAQRDMSCNQLVELSGVSRPTITAARSGKTVSLETAEKLAQVLGHKIIREEV